MIWLTEKVEASKQLPAHVRAGAPPTQALVQREHRDVAEVGHARDVLEEPEALNGAIDEEYVKEPAQEEVGSQHQPRAFRLCVVCGFVSLFVDLSHMCACMFV